MAPKAGEEKKESWQRAALGVGLALVGGVTACGANHWLQTREERKLYTILEPYFTSETNQAWHSLDVVFPRGRRGGG